MPYDEAYHFGSIQFYTNHLNPFLTSQPTSADSLGAIVREPSFIYHYLMSFPLHAISVVFQTVSQQVLALRFIDIALGVWALYLLYRLTRLLGASRNIANVSVLALAVTPAFFDLAGQLNYDNLLIPLTILSIIYTIKLVRSVRLGSASYTQFGMTISLILFTSLVKYTFLPIMAALLVYIFINLVLQIWRGRFQLTHSIKTWMMVGAGTLFVLSSGIWLQRYGVNMAVYRTPHPQCHAVLSVERCSSYAPWFRNHQFRQTIAAHPTGGLHLKEFSMGWTRSMYLGLFSTVHTIPGQTVFNPVVSVRIATKTFVVVALLYGLLRFRRIKRLPVAWGLLGLVSAVYIATLWGQNFSDYRHLGALVGIQGRYMLLVLPILYAIVAICYTQLYIDLKKVVSGNLVTGFPWIGPVVFREYIRVNNLLP